MADISSMMTDSEVMEEIGRRLAVMRAGRTIGEVAEAAGLNRETVSRAEKGDNPRLVTILRLLRAYGRVAAFDAFIADQEVSPMGLLRERRVKGEDG